MLLGLIQVMYLAFYVIALADWATSARYPNAFSADEAGCWWCSIVSAVLWNSGPTVLVERDDLRLRARLDRNSYGFSQRYYCSTSSGHLRLFSVSTQLVSGSHLR